jgi:hypothetical protein
MATSGNAAQVNREVLRRINREVSLRATRFANAMLSGVFRAIFRIEKAYEAAEPEVFQTDHDTDRILWSRVSPWHLDHLPLAIANEDVLASRYQLFTEYDFVVVADISQSMMLHWWHVYAGRDDGANLPTWRVCGDRTKLFFLKYTLASFLNAARTNDFVSFVYLVGNGAVRQRDSRREPDLSDTLLVDIDRHCRDMAEGQGPEPARLRDALRRIAARRRRAIVLCISDFTDALQYPGEREPRVSLRSLLLPLAEIAAAHRVLVLQILDRLEIAPQIEPSIKLTPKDCAYVNPEQHAENEKLGTVDQHQLEKHVIRVREFHEGLRLGLAQFGIKYEHVVANGDDDDRVDATIHRLGAATGV